MGGGHSERGKHFFGALGSSYCRRLRKRDKPHLAYLRICEGLLRRLFGLISEAHVQRSDAAHATAASSSLPQRPASSARAAQQSVSLLKHSHAF